MSTFTLSEREYKALMRGNGKKPKAAQIVVEPTKKSVIDTQGFKGHLEDALVIQTIGNGVHDRIIMHHPIGVTDLDDDEWVASTTEELNQLGERTKNPFTSILDGFLADRKKLSVPDWCSDSVAVYEDKIHFEGVPRNELKRAADKELKASWNGLYPPADYQPRKGEKKPKKRPKAPLKAYVLYMGDHARHEVEYLAFLKCEELNELVRQGLPETNFQTCKGVIKLTKQKAIPGLKGLEGPSVRREVHKRLLGISPVPAVPPAGTDYNEQAIGVDALAYVRDVANLVAVPLPPGGKPAAEELIRDIVDDIMEELDEVFNQFEELGLEPNWVIHDPTEQAVAQAE
jgi:hypothetical protein